MLSVKTELLQALAAVLEQTLPGAGARAVFESPKVAAHGDLATTVAMQLAKPLQRAPRQVAEALGQAGSGARGAGLRRALRPPPGAGAAHDGRVRLGQPHRPAARGPRPPG